MKPETEVARIVRQNTTRNGYSVDKKGLVHELADYFANESPQFDFDGFMDSCYTAPEQDLDHLQEAMSQQDEDTERLGGGAMSKESWHLTLASIAGANGLSPNHPAILAIAKYLAEPSYEDLQWHEVQLMNQQIEEGRLTDDPGSAQPQKLMGPFPLVEDQRHEEYHQHHSPSERTDRTLGPNANVEENR